MRTERIGDATLYTGDVMAVLATLPDESVHCVVTSPPYWGLRDYGTGTWEGGSAECDHRANGERRQLPHGDGRANDSYADERHIIAGVGATFKDICGKCGARRTDQQIGLESSPEEYVARMVAVFREVRRVLRKDGTCWLNLGDSYSGDKSGGHNDTDKMYPGSPEGLRSNRKLDITTGLKPKDLVGIPWMLAFALRADGWYLRSDIIWAKPNPMPESVTDRPTKAHEYLFLLSKAARYFYDAEAIREEGSGRNWMEAGGNLVGAGVHKANDGYRDNGDGRHGEAYGRNRRTVWTIATEPYPEAHFATFPRKLVQPCILAGCPEHACPKCGAPWEREVEKQHPPAEVFTKRNAPSDGMVYSGSIHEGEWKGHGQKLQDWLNEHPPRILGEHPTCACGLPAIGGTVLDPFGGSGTTAEVALEYGRRAILIELKPEYVELQKRRLAPVAGRPLLDFAGAPHA